MADPILPTRPGTIATSIPHDGYGRTNVNVGVPVDRPVAPGSGFGTGMLVAGIFVIIGILALFMFGDRFTVSQTPAPNVSIDNTNVPAADPAPAPSPADPIPVPDTGTADPVLPTPDPAAPANP